MTAIGVLRPPSTVLFGSGTVDAVGNIAARVGCRALVCTDAFLAGTAQLRRVVASLSEAGLEARVLDAAVPELPRATVEAAIDAARSPLPDVIVGLGGGSCIDLAKLVALGLSSDLPLDHFYGEGKVVAATRPVIAIPTTAGTGSEVTPVAVLTDPAEHLKVGISSPRLVPHAAICDPLLTYGAPAHVTAYAGIDALAHAIEAYCATERTGWDNLVKRVFVGRNVLSDRFALHAVTSIANGLRAAVADDPAAREQVLEGSLCAGLAFATAGTTLAHALQYPIGARTATPHGLGIGVLLPYTFAFNAAAVPDRAAAIAVALGVDDVRGAVSAIRQLSMDVGLPPSLTEIGVGHGDLGDIADQALGISRLIDNNPRVVHRQQLIGLLEAGLHGHPAALLASAPHTHTV